MPAKKTKMVRFQVAQINVDSNQYKPFAHTLLAENVFVDIPVDIDEVIDLGKQIVLTVDGLTSILLELGTAMTQLGIDHRMQTLGH